MSSSSLRLGAPLLAVVLCSSCDPASVSGSGICGDSHRDPDEECDGTDFGEMTCESLSLPAGSLSCDASCVIITSACDGSGGAICGNGAREGDELCDGYDFGGEDCVSLGQPDGTLACNGICQFNFSGCVEVEAAFPNLAGSHTERMTGDCTLYVKPDGDDDLDGLTLDNALRTPDQAMATAVAGDVVCFEEGSYSTLVVENVDATSGAPLVLRTLPGKERLATFGTGDTSSGHGVTISHSTHVHVYDLRLASAMKGIDHHSSTYGRIDGLLIEDLGQEAISIARKRTYDGSEEFLGPASHHTDVIFNTIRNTGLVNPGYGEGIYIGTGAFRGDDTHDIFIAYNDLEGISAEAIELKPDSYDHIVRGNLISDSSHSYNGAITVAVESISFRDGNYLIEDNRIYDYQSTEWSVAGIAIGHGNAIIRNNVIWGIDGGRGIRTFTTFANSEARGVEIRNNTIWNPGSELSISLDDGDAGTGIDDQLADHTLADNVTDDGSAGSTTLLATDFVGPVDGSADAGDGYGTGFRQTDYQGGGADLELIVPSE